MAPSIPSQPAAIVGIGASATVCPAVPPVPEDEAAVTQLESEIKVLRRELAETIQEHDAANEELKAANEEVVSMNEELQSTNEELETSKEELQSINEELNTVNSQLHDKVGELTEANNDLANLFSATQIATVFLDGRLRIKRFTPKANELLNLIPADVGRPLAHITRNFDDPGLAADIAAVISSLVPIEKEVQTAGGRWYTMRILPYRTLDNRIDGAVVTFADVTRLKGLEVSLISAKAYAESIVGTIREPLVVLDADLKVVSANPAFYQTFTLAPQAVVGKPFFELGGGLWDLAHLRERMADILPGGSRFEDIQVEREFTGIGRRIMRLNARPVAALDHHRPLILLVLEDVTEREQARQQIESLAAALDLRVKERTGELARAAAELEDIYNTAPVGLCLLDPQLRYVRINERLADMHGRPVAEHIGRTFRQVVPAIADVMEPNARQVLATGQAVLNVEGSGFLALPDRKRAHWLASYLPVKAADGTVAGVTGMVLDITDRKLAQERASAMNMLLAVFALDSTREQYLKSMVAKVQDVVGCRCVGVRIRNDRGEIPYEASTGFSPAFLASESALRIGQDECACTRIVTARPLPCDAAALTPAGSFFCNDTAAFVAGLTPDEKRFFRGVCVENGFASVAVVPVRHHDKVVGIIHMADEQPDMFAQDVVAFMETISPLIGEAAHRFHVENQLRRSEERYRSLVMATTPIVWTTNARGEVDDDIPAWRKFSGQSLEQIRGRGWNDALHPEDRQRTMEVWSQAVAAQSDYKTEYRIRRADGRYRDFSVRGMPVLEPDGTIREWVGTCTDITEHKQADEQLREMNASLEQRACQLRALATELTLAEQQERKRLAQILHDDLQQLLAAAKLGIGALSGSAPGVLQESIHHLDGLLAESLKVTRSLAVQLNPPALATRGLEAAMRWLAGEMQKFHGLTVQVTADNEIPADTDGVAILLFQAVRELLFNVVKHAGVRSATVDVARLAGNLVRITVADQGSGFAPDAAAAQKASPTGMGLFGIRKRIAHMGGRMEIQSAPGQGSRFTLTVPFNLAFTCEPILTG